VPALKDGDLQVSDSSVILDYLEEQYAEISLRPDSPELRARSRWYEEWADTKLIEATSPFFFEHLAKKAFGDPSPPDEERLQQVAAEIVPVMFDYLESQAPQTGFMFGEELGIADIALLSPVINGEYGGFSVDADAYPRSAAYLDRIRSHPAVAQALAAEKGFVEALAA
jgi:glutathione S-transferase